MDLMKEQAWRYVQVAADLVNYAFDGRYGAVAAAQEQIWIVLHI